MAWPKDFPKEEALRRDISYMIDSVMKALFRTFKKKDIAAVYFKGSANKKWDSPIDYVPEVSDVDIHVLFSNQGIFEKEFSTIERVMKFNLLVEKEYAQHKNAVHQPLLQMLSLNEMHTEAEYVPSLKEAVSVIYGREYPHYIESLHGRDFKKRAAAQILEHEPFLKAIRKRGVYKYGTHLNKYVHELSWRLSSSGPNFLCLNGYAYENAWFLNRTSIVNEMKHLGNTKLAKYYYEFYINCWQYFIHDDVKHLRQAIICGYHALDLMISNAKDY